MTTSPTIPYQKILTPIGFGTAISLLGDATLYMVLPLPEISAIAGVTLFEVGVLLGLNRLVRVITNGAAGVLLDRFPRRPLMIISLAIGAFSTAIYAMGHGFLILALGRILWGIAWSGIWIGGNAAALDISDDSNRGRVNGRLQMWFFAGSAVSSLAGGVLTDLFGFRQGLWISFGCMVLAVGFWIFRLQETRNIILKGLPPGSREIVQVRKSFSWLISIKTSVPYFMTRMIFAGVVSSTTILWMAQFAHSGFQVGDWILPLATLTGAYSFFRVSIGVLSAPISGYLSDRLGKRWMVMGMFLVAGAGGLALMGFPFLGIATLGSIFAAIASGCIQALVPAVIGDRIPEEQRGRALSVVYTSGDIGSAIGPIIGLGLIPLIGLPTTYGLCGFVYFLTAGFAAWQSKSESRLHA